MISVIVPVYNVEQYIEKLLLNLKQQTDPMFEVVLVNDGSKDRSGDLCDAASKSDSRFRVIHQTNQGVAMARNNGMKAAKGELIAFLDADDEIPQNYIQTLKDKQIETGADIVVCDVALIQDGREKYRFTSNDVVLNQQVALNYLLTRRVINSGPCAKLFKRQVVGNTVFPKLKAYEDILFVKDVFSKAKSIAITNNTEYRYTQNIGSAMSRFSEKPSLDIIIATENLIDFINSKNDLSPDCFYITLSHLFQYVQKCMDKDDAEAKAFIYETRLLYRKNTREIVTCKAFPFKEKILFVLFSCGLYSRKERAR